MEVPVTSACFWISCIASMSVPPLAMKVRKSVPAASSKTPPRAVPEIWIWVNMLESSDEMVSRSSPWRLMVIMALMMSSRDTPRSPVTAMTGARACVRPSALTPAFCWA